MELYFKDLISADTSLEKLVDDLSLIVQGADDLANAVGTQLTEQKRQEVTTRLKRLKERCQRLKEQTIAGAHATDKLLRKHPYSSLAVIFGLGFLIGARMCRK
jgi:ElaB/YqjD/DUF883 family membrane-anchored ribosome-binding protein